MLNLMDFTVNTGGKGIAHLADSFFCLKLDFALTFWFLDLILKSQLRCCLALRIIENTLFFEDFSRWEGFTGSIQTLMRFFRFGCKTLNFLCGAGASRSGLSAEVSAAFSITSVPSRAST